MRKILFFSFACVVSLSMKAQKVEQYCQMTAMQKLLSKKVTIDIDYGEERKLFSFKDTRVKDELGKVKNFNSVTDALNHMGRSGWKLINAFPVSDGSQLIYHYVFKREFETAELAQEQTK